MEIRQAMNTIEANTAVRFIEKKFHEPFRHPHVTILPPGREYM